MCTAVLHVLPMHGIPRSEPERKVVAADLSISPNSIKWCCGTIEGIEIEIANPTEVYDPAQYWNRIGYYEIPVQAVVDSDIDYCTCLRCVLAPNITQSLLPPVI